MAAREKFGLIPHLVVNGASKAVEFYKTALGAVEVVRMPEENGPRLMHVELKIGDAAIFLCDDFPEHCAGTTIQIPDVHPLSSRGCPSRA